jgi:predicted PurR-regulated permease PerM
MFSIDDRTGNVVTTVALFLVAAAILYLARGAFFILLLSLLFAYLLEPAVTFVQEHTRLSRKNRTRAIAQVYLIGALVLGSLGYDFGPHLVAQMKNLNAAVPEILQDLSSGRAAADLGAKHGLNLGEQQPLITGWPRTITFSLAALNGARHLQATSPKAWCGCWLCLFSRSSPYEMDGG